MSTYEAENHIAAIIIPPQNDTYLYGDEAHIAPMKRLFISIKSLYDNAYADVLTLEQKISTMKHTMNEELNNI